MDKEALVTSLRQWAIDHEKMERPFSLLMLVPMDPAILADKYSLVVSAPWLDEKSPREATTELLKELIERFGSTASSEYASLTRVSIPKSTDPFVEGLIRRFQVGDQPLDVVDVRVGDSHLDRAILIATKSDNPAGAISADVPVSSDSLSKLRRYRASSNDRIPEGRQTMPNTDKGLRVFYSYSHADEAFRQQLENHLAILRRKGVIAEWHDRRIPPGAAWKDEIDIELERADIILLLISSDFLASDYCYDVEVQKALARQEKGEAVVIPVIVRPSDFHDSPFGKLQALPPDAEPVSIAPNQDEAWLSVAQGIRRVCEQLLTQRIAREVETQDELVDANDAIQEGLHEEDFGIIDFSAELEAAMEVMIATQEAITAHTVEVTRTLVDETDEVNRLKAVNPADGARQARKLAGKMAASLAGYGKAMELRARELGEAWQRVHSYFPQMLQLADTTDPEQLTDLREAVSTLDESHEAIADARRSTIEAKKNLTALAKYSAALKLGVRKAERGIQKVVDEYWTMETTLDRMKKQVLELLPSGREA